ncbi:stage II sporulation protein R [Paenibacillus cremeus]|uniref:Stage II sporulation protein R n=1 Tax=Paenibacillus cremeus TaxID=2163881 RepID=A0A559KAX6_9BACL|nr:stage II sporulation protein R [Paenibacillus cremeus]TVY09275.1 stage II sporulation protein R [Paenibacillus cremeus]
MVKRFAWKRYAYLLFAFMVMLACWESNRSDGLLYAAPSLETDMTGPAIPQDAIRLRILANSDAPSDQWVKREVRDAISQEMSSWVTTPKSIEEARAIVREHLPEMEQVVGETLQKNGFDYNYKVELGNVPFPSKMYSNHLYPAGDYEALRVSIGAAEGQNWWCVLFPPLCFVDSEMMIKNNTAHAEAASAADTHTTGKTVKETAVKQDSASKKVAAKAEASSERAPQPEIHFFLWDLLKKVGAMFA